MIVGRENWRPVVGFEGAYEVSDLGNVRSVERRAPTIIRGTQTTRLIHCRLLKPGKSGPFGHVTVALGRGKSRTVHSLVMEAFIGPRPAGSDIAHADGNGGNNRLSNLRYATRSENNRDRVLQHRTRLAPTDVHFIREVAPTLARGGKRALAERFGISPCGISDILARRTYAHV